MKIYLDSCDIELITKYRSLGLIDGVTTNPSMIARSLDDSKEIIKKICELIDTSVSVGVISTKFHEIIEEAENLSKIAPQIIVKLPANIDGLSACKVLSNKSIKVNMTLCFSAAQALFAAKCGATYVSPFVGRLDDIGVDGLKLVQDICKMFENYPEVSTQILAASVRSPLHVIELAKLGVDVITIPPNLIHLITENPLTEKGVKAFTNDWKTKR